MVIYAHEVLLPAIYSLHSNGPCVSNRCTWTQNKPWGGFLSRKNNLFRFCVPFDLVALSDLPRDSLNLLLKQPNWASIQVLEHCRPHWTITHATLHVWQPDQLPDTEWKGYYRRCCLVHTDYEVVWLVQTIWIDWLLRTTSESDAQRYLSLLDIDADKSVDVWPTSSHAQLQSSIWQLSDHALYGILGDRHVSKSVLIGAGWV